MTTPSAKAVVFCENVVFREDLAYTILDGVFVDFRCRFEDSGESEATSFWVWVWFVSHAGPAGKGTVTLCFRTRFRQPQLEMHTSAQSEIDFTHGKEQQVQIAVKNLRFPEPGTYVLELFFDGTPAGIQEIEVFEV